MAKSFSVFANEMEFLSQCKQKQELFFIIFMEKEKKKTKSLEHFVLFLSYKDSNCCVHQQSLCCYDVEGKQKS
jgi:hypothetical protein